MYVSSRFYLLSSLPAFARKGIFVLKIWHLLCCHGHSLIFHSSVPVLLNFTKRIETKEGANVLWEICCDVQRRAGYLFFLQRSNQDATRGLGGFATSAISLFGTCFCKACTFFWDYAGGVLLRFRPLKIRTSHIAAKNQVICCLFVALSDPFKWKATQ